MNKPFGLGISFVVMRENINELKNIEKLIEQPEPIACLLPMFCPTPKKWRGR